MLLIVPLRFAVWCECICMRLLVMAKQVFFICSIIENR